MIILIILLGLLLRVVNLNQSFWLDEAAQVIESIRPFSQQFNITSDFHPPLFHLLLHFWMYFGTSEIWVRLLSVSLGVISIYLIYKIGESLGSSRVGLLTALFLAISPYHLWYSQEGRPYMLFVTVSLFSTLMLIKKNWIFYWFGVVLCLYSLYFSPFLILGHLTYVYFFEKKYLKQFLFSTVAAFIFFIPWLPSFIKQLDRGINGTFSGWTNVVSVTPLKAVPLAFAKFIFGKGSIENLIIYGLVILPMFTIFILSVWKVWRRREGKIISILFFIPFLTAIIGSLFVPVIAPQRLIFLLPIFLLIIAYGIDSLKKILGVTAFLIIIITSISAVADYYTNPYIQREQWRQAVSYIEENGEKNNLAVFIFPEPFAPYLWYETGKIEAVGIAPRFRVQSEDLEKLSAKLTNKSRIYLFQYLTGLTDPANLTARYIESQGYKQSITKDFPGVGFVYLFEKI